jgi:hypothetical protein
VIGRGRSDGLIGGGKADTITLTKRTLERKVRDAPKESGWTARRGVCAHARLGLIVPNRFARIQSDRDGQFHYFGFGMLGDSFHGDNYCRRRLLGYRMVQAARGSDRDNRIA